MFQFGRPPASLDALRPPRLITSVKCFMTLGTGLAVVAIAALVLQGCGSPNPKPESTAPPGGLAAVPQPFVPQTPPDLQAFGAPGVGRIQVTIYGEIRQPGIYYLPEGSTVGDAITLAGGLTDFTAWDQSRLVRPGAAKSVEILRFTRRARRNDEHISLKDGDRLYFGRHVD